jgi:hypothetical protein
MKRASEMRENTIKRHERFRVGAGLADGKRGLSRGIRLVLAIVGAACICVLGLCMVLFTRSESVGAYIVGGLVGAVVGFCGTWVVAGLVYKVEWVRFHYVLPKITSIMHLPPTEYDEVDEETKKNENITAQDM